MSRKIALFALIAIGIIGLFIYGCSKSGGSNNNPYGNNNNNNNNNTSGSNISIASMSFGSDSIIVKAGTTVKWTNNDNTTHTVTANDDSYNSGDIAPGGSYSYTFSTVGKFSYHCKYHSMMVAAVVVN